MKATMIALAGMAVFAAGSASAAEPLIDKGGMTGPEVVAWLTREGYKAELTKDDDGDPMIRSAAESLPFNVYFYDCEKERCRALQFSSGFDLKDGLSLAKVNQWNRENRYLKAYLDDDSDPYVQYDVNVNAGRTISGLNDDFAVWVSMVHDFATFIDW